LKLFLSRDKPKDKSPARAAAATTTKEQTKQLKNFYIHSIEINANEEASLSLRIQMQIFVTKKKTHKKRFYSNFPLFRCPLKAIARQVTRYGNLFLCFSGRQMGWRQFFSATAGLSLEFL
jgi:hypothetical protein